MKTWIIVRKQDLEVVGSYMAEEKDDTSNNRSHLLAEPHCSHLELTGDLEADLVDCEMDGDEMVLVHSDSKEEAQIERAWAALRGERDRRLLESDKYVLVDYPISGENLIAMKAYRNDLRDLPSSVVDPRLTVSWPAQPEV